MRGTGNLAPIRLLLRWRQVKEGIERKEKTRKEVTRSENQESERQGRSWNEVTERDLYALSKKNMI